MSAPEAHPAPFPSEPADVAVLAIARRCALLAAALGDAIGQLRGYAQSDFDSWTNDEEEFDDTDLERENAEAWAAIGALEAVLLGAPPNPGAS